MLTMRTIADSASKPASRKIDWGGAGLSALGLGLIVLGVLQTSSWGLFIPRGGPEIGGETIQPFGLSIVPFMIAAGVAVMFGFTAWERRVARGGGTPLMHPEILKNGMLKSGLSMLGAQQIVIAGTFFVLPIYLQYVLGKSAFETGLKIMPMSIAMLVGAGLGPKLAVTKSPRWIVRIGLWLMAAGAFVLVASMTPELRGALFAFGMALFGGGAGLLASQLGNVIMSSVDDSERGEAGGLQGTFQNIGSSVGVALIGAVLMTSLSSGFTTDVETNPAISQEAKALVSKGTADGVDILTQQQVDQAVDASSVSDADKQAVKDTYADAQVESLKLAMLFAGFLALLGLAVARKLPDIPGVELAKET
jgi:Na+/melibiose symporter-like transporter